MKAFRAEEPEILLPTPYASAAPEASGGWPEGGRKVSRRPATLRAAAAGCASCYLRGRLWSRWIASAWAPATCSWRSRELAPGGGGGAAGAGPERQLPAAVGPRRAAPPAPANQWPSAVGSYANLQRHRHSLRKAQSPPSPSPAPRSAPSPSPLDSLLYFSAVRTGADFI